MIGFPWNSALQTKCASFFMAGIESGDPDVLSYFFEKMKLHSRIASLVEKENVGYVGVLIQIAESIQKCGKERGAYGVEWEAFCERVLHPLQQKKDAFEQMKHCFVWGKHIHKLHYTATTPLSIGRSTSRLVVQCNLDSPIEHLLQTGLCLRRTLHVAIRLDTRGKLLSLGNSDRFQVLLCQFFYCVCVVAEIGLQTD